MANMIETGRIITLRSAQAAYKKQGHKVFVERGAVIFDGERMSDREFLIMAMSDFQVA